MFSAARVIVPIVWVGFIAALAYAGYVNELLKDAVAPWHRGILLMGFIIGAGATSRHLAKIADQRFRIRKQTRR
ncbi:MAG: hypothetical protein B7Z08_11535 [Sphingomonadales bacterium 32-68-7]|nr:MAG: hypothetical protein B7Z33_08360 [Sphingomonadales bacterium 12-68-11]OYX07944.1 MAG: hypothetical protein B7Z08_11535 [Sphingomonadales bacterium 32-68-7]